MVANRMIASVGTRIGLRDLLRLRSLSVETVALAICAVVVILMVMVPVLMLFSSTFEADVLIGPTYYTLENFQFLVSPRIITALTNTLIVATGGTLLAGLLGISLALIIARTNTPLRGVFEFLVIVPFFLAPFIGALAWSYLGSPQTGLLNGLFTAAMGADRPLFSIYTHVGMIWVLGLFFTPFFYLFVVAPLRRIDASIEEAARVCGCRPDQVVRRITLPLVLPAILSAALLSFVSAAGEFGVPLALGAPYGTNTLSTEIFSLAHDMPPRFNAAAATGSVLLVLALVFIYVQRRIILPRDFTTITGKSGQPRQLDLGRWRYATLAYMVIYSILAVFAPMGTLFLVSMTPSWRGTIDLGNLTLTNFAYLPTSGIAMRGIQHSFILAVGGATVAMVLGTIISWMIYRSRAPGRGLLDFISTIPVGVPGIVLAMGILVAYIRTPLYGTLVLIAVGYISRFLPTAQRSVSGTILSLSRDLDESARTSGASWLRTMWRINVPLLLPGIISGWVILFVIFLREFPISILLYRDGLEVLSIAIWNLVMNETAPRAAALMFAQFMLVFVSLVIFRRILGKDALT